MTMIELQKILGETVEAVRDGSADVEQAKTIAGLAKQMINIIIFSLSKVIRHTRHNNPHK